MGMHCCCGVKKRDKWVCLCDWGGWFLCFQKDQECIRAIPVDVPVKEIPDKDGVYFVRVFEDGDYREEKSEFCTLKKNWGKITNKAISHWEIEYDDNWMGYCGVYAWKDKEIEECSK